MLQIPLAPPILYLICRIRPWHCPLAEHSAALTRWLCSRQEDKMPKNLQNPFTDWVLYRPRLVFKADI